MSGMPLGGPWVPSSPRLLLLVLFLFFCGAAVPPQLFDARFGLHLAPPGSPKAPFESQNVPVYTIKPMILQGRLFAQSCPQGSPINHQRPPQGPQRSPQGWPRDPRDPQKDPRKAPRFTQGAPGTPQGHTRSPQSCPRAPNGPPRSPKATCFHVPVACRCLVRSLHGGAACLRDVLSCTGSVRAAAEP